MDSNDKFILFVAGHGYFSKTYSAGNIVFNDTKSYKEDPFLDSYLQMATLRGLLNSLPCKGVFAVFDICFGASFDLLSKDITLSRYDVDMDISPVELNKRKSKELSRIFLASGRYEVPDYWDNTLNHSPFAQKLINTLEAEELFISPGKLFEGLEGNATEAFLKQFGSHHDKADFILTVE